MSVDICAKNNLFIRGTIFPHKRCHKIPWVSPDFRIENQTEQFAINRKSLLDICNWRGANIGSNHHLMTANIAIKISASTKKFQKRKSSLIPKV